MPAVTVPEAASANSRDGWPRPPAAPAAWCSAAAAARRRVRFGWTGTRRPCLAGQLGWISPIGPKPSCGVSM
jgi:hypothetical protein